MNSKLIGVELNRTVTKYFEVLEHRKDFEDWYFNKYGIPYKLQKDKDNHYEKDKHT